MGIERIVETTAHCDICGECIAAWRSGTTGVSKEWAKVYIREDGASTGKLIKCKECRIQERIEKCALIKKYGATARQAGKCKGFESQNNKCVRCIAYAD